MPSISMLIKPASSICNMKCRYCFYHDEAANRSVASYGIMKADTADAIIRRAMNEATLSVTFAFQGGEPTAAGLDYFERFCELVKGYNKNNLKVVYSIQTNGIYLNGGKWAEFFKKNDFLVGLSFDGLRECHDLNRVDTSGKGTAARVLANADLLDKYKVEYNILTVVNASTARRIVKIYNFYKKRGWRYLQFIPCLDPLEDGGDNSFQLSAESWLRYNKTLFDLWYPDYRSDILDGCLPISIRHFDDYLRTVYGIRPEACGTTGICAIQNVIEADGSVYPCDFMATDEYKLGNIKTESFRELFESNRAQDFIRTSCIHSEKCRQCRWYGICVGGCARMKHDNQYIYCEANKAFYDYTYERITELSKLIIRG